MLMVPTQDFEKYLLKKGCPRSSVRYYSFVIQQFIDWSEGRQIDHPFITYPELIEYLKHLKSRHIKQQTIRGYCIALRHYYDHLVTQGLTITNPFHYLRIKVADTHNIHTLLTKSQLEALHSQFDVRAGRVSQVTDLPIAQRQKVTVGLMVFQGLNTNSLGQLATHHLDLTAGVIHVPRNRKQNERTLALNPAQIMELYRYLDEVRPQLIQHYPQDGERKNTLLVHGYENYRDTQPRLIKKLKKLQPLVTSARQIRAAVITHWLKSYNLREVQYMAGHRYVSTTEKYLKADAEALRQDIDLLHPLNSQD